MKIMDGAFKNEEWKEVGGWVWTVMTYIHPCLWLGFGWAFCAKSLQSCLTHCDPVDCSPPGCSIHGILQAWILERVALPSSRGSSRPRDQTHISKHLLVWSNKQHFAQLLPGRVGVDFVGLSPLPSVSEDWRCHAPCPSLQNHPVQWARPSLLKFTEWSCMLVWSDLNTYLRKSRK